VSIGRIGVDSRFLSELSLPPLLNFTSCVKFFLEIQILTLDSPAEGVIYVEFAQSQDVIMVV
jgi:hypothetical protein